MQNNRNEKKYLKKKKKYALSIFKKSDRMDSYEILGVFKIQKNS